MPPTRIPASCLLLVSASVSAGTAEQQAASLMDNKRETAALFKKSSHPNNEHQANKNRVELWFYWEKRLNRAYLRLMRHYSSRPTLAEPLKASQQAWLTTRDATMRAFGLCLRQGNETGHEDSWFNAHMNLMIIEMTETRCLILEELLNAIQSCYL
ncbi:lysozyme inhibitor LprI family protein [uncultured Akkermansia sp.]|uniref:lysozyme inhibitor LprI family protein n=1 Tax=uncultured Akkermansia sp. TaxID=512294 RepID=UPI002630BD3D|nr:lysozyme inhibitor LprI family protein [uncultured Akkermansia sp.]